MANPVYRIGSQILRSGAGAGPWRQNPPGSFSTTFAGADQDPLVDGTNWSHAAGNSWKGVRRVGGIAKPNALTNGPFDDCYALCNVLQPTDAEVIITLYRNGATHGEYEIIVRGSDSTTQAKGYELMCNTEGSPQIVRWNGPFQSFTDITGGTISVGTLADGHQLRGLIQGAVIGLYWRASPGDGWTQIADANDSTYASGRCGIGFYGPTVTGANIDNTGIKSFALTPA